MGRKYNRVYSIFKYNILFNKTGLEAHSDILQKKIVQTKYVRRLSALHDNHFKEIIIFQDISRICPGHILIFPTYINNSQNIQIKWTLMTFI